MKRYALEALRTWKKTERRKPLILWGARQVGKTWLLREFAQTEYTQLVYLNFDENPELAGYFEQNLDTGRIIRALETHYKVTITPADTLIVFDELQECQRAKDSLKYFKENAPQYHIAAAGSYLGVAHGRFPVGAVDSLTLYPMTFYEFLEAIGRDQLVEAIHRRDRLTLESLSGLLTDTLKTYLYVGGMPAVVNDFVQTGGNLTAVRTTQKEILANYKDDFYKPKYMEQKDIPKVRMFWDSIPVHLAREKKKFMYKDVKTGGRAAEFENAMNWLVNTGLVYKIPRTVTPQLPLERDQERETFKVFMLDTGLLCAKANIDIAAFYRAEPKIFHDFHGAISEQYVCQELTAAGIHPLFYWGRDKGEAEVDFIVQHKNEIIPIEVKSAYNKQAKSLNVYMNEYRPHTAVRTSLRNYGFDGTLHSIPLYMIASLGHILG